MSTSYWSHKKIYSVTNCEQYVFTFSIPKFKSINSLNINTTAQKILNGNSYFASLCSSDEKFTFSIGSTCDNLKCLVSLSIDNGMPLFSNTLTVPSRPKSTETYSFFDLITLIAEEACFEKLKQYPNGTLVVICRIKYPANSHNLSSVKKCYNSSTKGLDNIRTLAADLKNSVETLSEEKVILRIETSMSVSRAILCARSPVFAKMFQNDMKEQKDKIATITDIKTNVFEALISFLYTGNLPNFEFNFMCELYYAADKYDIADLRQFCVDSLLKQISTQNVFRILKFAFAHNDTQLRYAAMATIATNIETLSSTNEWKDLINEEPKIANEVIDFFDF